MAILEIHDLTREFTRRGSAFPAVDHVNLTIDTGEFVAIVGRSGNGKSTLLNLVTGLLSPTSGTVRVDGHVVGSLNDRDMARLRNRTIGFVTQSATLLANLTVLDNVILPAVMLGEPAADGNDDDTPSVRHATQDTTATPATDPDMPDVIAPAEADATTEDALTRRARTLLDALQVSDLADCYPKELSGGEMRRVSIARALMNRPKLLIADEPTGDLDADSTAIVMRLLRQTADAGTAVLMVTHDPDALGYVDRTYRMDRGVLTTA
ncbi:ABC transporter ATP-binding protein [Bifidobacterium ramosum]|uniref:ABC transporter ATP-binding protein n=1 Tax=Bifidobacterium ramosum TaxID=1798158 RepID=A0A6L4WYM7_9BIFI|nr:ABC transporter ATP-binding protein [Bifidobacterium ramosum]KAB8287437.1 ABC transporter ATP-binding protein [Bifidobacterium ramosum]NEG72157.1 ATP-binding cassette domain-containing protein [Bifidobacterium ramosum]